MTDRRAFLSRENIHVGTFVYLFAGAARVDRPRPVAGKDKGVVHSNTEGRIKDCHDSRRRARRRGEGERGLREIAFESTAATRVAGNMRAAG